MNYPHVGGMLYNTPLAILPSKLAEIEALYQSRILNDNQITPETSHGRDQNHICPNKLVRMF